MHERLVSQLSTRVLEIGFGLGLNCLLCADSASVHGATLRYTSIEHAPISAATLNDLNYAELLTNPTLASQLSQIVALSNDKPQQQLNGSLGEHTDLALHIDDATSPALLTKLRKEPSFDAIFLDAFSPDVNPECWTQTFFDALSQLISPNGRLATYCVKGYVRRNLEAAGFSVHKYPGPKGKREVLWASLNSSQIELK